MRYLPKSPEERSEMLRAIGCESVEDLFASIPLKARLGRPLSLERGRSEPEVLAYFRERAAENVRDYTCFLGAGAYDWAIADGTLTFTPVEPRDPCGGRIIFLEGAAYTRVE